MLGAAAATVALAGLGCSGGGDDEEGGPDEGGAPAVPDEVVAAYADAERTRGGLTLPPSAGAGDPVPVVVLVHGGFWRPGYDRAALAPLVAPLVARGWATWNLDQRTLGDGAGWPTTFADAAAAVDHVAALAEEHPLDTGRVAVVGHGSGAALALWSATRDDLPAGAPGADPRVVPTAVAALGGVVNLAAASVDDLGDGAVDELMGASTLSAPDHRYLLASPIERLPLDVPVLLVHGEDDPLVPADQARALAERATDAGDRVTLEVVPGRHLDVVDPAGEAWAITERWLADHLG